MREYDDGDDDAPAVDLTAIGADLGAPVGLPPAKGNRSKVVLENGNVLHAIEPTVEVPLEFTEFGLADAFSDSALGRDAKHTAKFGMWHIWDGARWVPDEKRQISNMARQHISNVLKTRDGWRLSDRERKVVQTRAQIANVLAIAGPDPRHAMKVEDWDKNDMLLGVPGGYVDLSTGLMHPPDRALNMTRSALVAPAPLREAGEDDDPHPVWSALLNKSVRGDAEMLAYLRRWGGYCLTGLNTHKAFLVLHGPTDSGKSTFLRTLHEILNTYSINAPMEMFMATQHPAHPAEIMRLNGARLIVGSESAEGSRWNEARLKTLTGGDIVSGRPMGGEWVDFRMTGKICLSSNNRPALRDTSQAMSRRLHLVSFPDTIPESERDKGMAEKLRAEYPAILRWMIGGCLDLLARNDLARPASVTDATDHYMLDEDGIATWLSDCCEVNSLYSEPIQQVYKSFKGWADQSGEYVPPQKRFLQRLQEKGFDRVAVGSFKHVSGLRILATGE